MSRQVMIAGVGMTKFVKPGAHDPYRVMGAQAVADALDDAGLDYQDAQQAFGGYIYGETASAQHALYDLGKTGIPVFNVNNACASGSSALFLARQAVASGEIDCAIALGFEEMTRGAIGIAFADREAAFGRALNQLDHWGLEDAPLALRCFGAAGMAYLEETGASADLFAKIAVKSRKHSIKNPRALFDRELTVEEVLQAPRIFGDRITRLMACPPTCGAAAAVIVSEQFARKKGLGNLVRVSAQAVTTDNEATWTNPIDLVGRNMAHRAAAKVYDLASIGPEDVDVVELHDCFTMNEAIAYEALGLCADGEASKLAQDGDNTYGGKFVVNPSGGLMSKGHPIGATGLAQCFELTTQLRGLAGERQVDGAKIGLQHNLGLGGACVVSLYQAI